MNTWRSIFLAIARRWPHWSQATTRCVIVCIFVLVFTQTSDPPPSGYYRRQLRDQVSELAFDFTLWELTALLGKLGTEFAAPQDTLTQAERHQLVTDYFDALREIGRLRWEVNQIYSQLKGQEAIDRAAPQEVALADLRSWLSRRQNLVEGILEEEVTTELEAEGFGRWGCVLPPVKIRFTPLPLLLVTSPRSEITRSGDVHLKAGIPLTERELLEGKIEGAFEDKSALVSPIGGLSAFPAMVLETDSLVWLADTFAHEWAHHLFISYPLGYHYTDSGQMTSINETSASIVGREIGRRMILRYYPELQDRLPPLPTPPETPPMSGGELVWPDEPPPDQFDYNREMRQTRLQVDDLLAAGKVDEAEAYMEQRRLLFVEHGHNIRRLNQAYFSFHGSYATSPSTGNPIGGQLEWLRGQSTSLRDFVRTVTAFSAHQDLLDRIQQ